MNRALHTLPQRIQRDFRKLTGGLQLDSGTITLQWDEATAPADPNVEGDYATPVPATAQVNALIHWVSMRSIQQGVTIFQAGDAIVSFDGAQDLTQPGLSFVLPDGKTYVQAAAGREVNEWWDVHLGGTPLTRTLLLRLQ